jgi:hypothetical protein
VAEADGNCVSASATVADSDRACPDSRLGIVGLVHALMPPMTLKWLPAFVLCATSGCVTVPGPAALRASREFRCPQSRILSVTRTDIEEGVVDVRACGQVARYNCFQDKYGGHCIREPMDAKDVDAIISLPEPAKAPVAPPVAPPLPPIAGRRVCRDRSDFDENRNCVLVQTH